MALLGQVHDLVDIVEIGTPFIITEGMRVVRKARKGSHDLTVLAFIKISGAGGYIWHDLESAGLSAEFKATMRDPGYRPVDEWWPVIEPYWQHVRHGSYAKALRIAVRDLYGISEINGSTIKELAQRVVDDNKPGLYKRTFKDRCNIERTITNIAQASFPDDPAIVGITSLFKFGGIAANPVKVMAERTGREPDDIVDLADACQALMREELTQGAAGFKFLAAHTADPDEKLAVEDFRMAKEERRSSRQPDPTDFSALFSVP